MRKFAVLVLSLILSSADSWATGSVPDAPQTARQALLEMFFSKESGSFLRHLPAATRATLEKSGALTSMQPYSLLAGQLQAQGKSFQTFETGPVMLAAVDPKTGHDTNTRLLFELRVIDGRWCLDSAAFSGTESKVLTDHEKLHPLGLWYHSALVYDGHELRNYVDGVLEGSGPAHLAPQGPGHSSIGVRRCACGGSV